MGRKTWESIPKKFRPLKDRINIILTRNKNYNPGDNVFCVSSLEEAYSTINSIQNSNKKNIFIIGGGSIYSECLQNPNCNKLYITRIYKKYECDSFFPDIPSKFKLSTVSPYFEENGVYYQKLTYINSDISIVNEWKNMEEFQYLDCLNRIVKTGNEITDRTGVGTYSLFGQTFRYDISDTFPLLTTKKMWVRAIFEELKFYLSGKTDNTILNSKGITIWNGNTTREFLDKRGLTNYPENDMGESYGFNFRHYGAEYKTCQDDYTGQGFDQVKYVIDLIKNNPSSRIIIDLETVQHFKAALPCLCKYQFYVNQLTKNQT